MRQSEREATEKNEKIKKLEQARDSALDELRAETQKNTSRIQLLEQKLEESAVQNKKLMLNQNNNMLNNATGPGLSIQNPHTLTEDGRLHNPHLQKDGVGMADYSDFNNNSQLMQNINSTNGFTIVSATQSINNSQKGLKQVNENVKKMN